jgi:hypothetical protein
MKISDKISTFSYGPFSCSLQGFEDEFDVLKPIAEYFHDLWAQEKDGRTKLPVPDADVLARIVSDVIAHPVEGYEAKGVIILKPVAESETPCKTPEAIKNDKDVNGWATDAADPVAEDALLTTQEEEALEAQLRGAERANDENIFEDEASADEALNSEFSDDDLDNIFGDAVAPENAGSQNAADAAADEIPMPLVQPSRLARVIKMKRKDFDAAIAGGVIEEDTQTPDVSAAQTDRHAPDQGLSMEDEARLKQQLADVEAATGEAVVKPTKPEVSNRRRSGADRLASSERRSDMERIFEKADNHLVRSDTSQRRKAIQHLRAAVAATRAEETSGQGLNLNVDEKPYRADWAEAVDAPAGPHKISRARRRHSSALPTLVLTTDQRIR